MRHHSRCAGGTVRSCTACTRCRCGSHDDADREHFVRLSSGLIGNDAAKAAVSQAGFIEYLNELIANTTKNLGGNVLSGLIRARDDDDRLNHDELLATLRAATVPIELSGARINAGDVVLVSLLAAGRDESPTPWVDDSTLIRGVHALPVRP